MPTFSPDLPCAIFQEWLIAIGVPYVCVKRSNGTKSFYDGSKVQVKLNMVCVRQVNKQNSHNKTCKKGSALIL